MRDAHTTNALWWLIGFELISTQPQQSARYLPAYAFGANFKSSKQFCRTLYLLLKERDSVNLLRFNIYCIFSLFFSILKSVKELNPYCLHILLFYKLPTLHRQNISSFMSSSKLHSCVGIIRIFQIFKHLHSCILWQHHFTYLGRSSGER
jgi:hypothetical protein